MFSSTKEAVTQGHSQVYGFIPQEEMDRTEGKHTYARLSKLTDGAVNDFANFVKGGRKAKVMLERQLKLCVQNLQPDE